MRIITDKAKNEIGKRLSAIYYIALHGYGKDTSYVVCVKCASRGEFFCVSPKYASAERAIAAWNRRTKNERSD